MERAGNRRNLWGAAGMVLAASLLIFYSLTLEQRRMIGDEAGHDPGSRALPLGSGLVMLIAGIYDLGKRLRTPKKQERIEVSRPEGGLFWGTVVGCILYLLLLEGVGFLILTTLFLYLLFFFYSKEAEKGKGAENTTKTRQEGEESKGRGAEKDKSDTPTGLAAGVLACVLVALCYIAGRIVSRELFYWGRSMGSPVLASRTVSVLVFLLMSGSIYLGALLFGRRIPFWKERSVKWSMALSVGTTLILFIVFRMIFRVVLPLGILDL